MRRTETSTFVPGAWVFPGGTLEASDRCDGDDDATALRRCAIREVLEETGIWLGEALADAAVVRQRLLGGATVGDRMSTSLGTALDDLVLTARWVTPAGIPKRYDTWFFLASVADDVEGTPDDAEGLELAWLTPADALRRHREGAMPMVFPTIRTLEDLATFPSRTALVESRRNETIRVTRPVLVTEGGQKKIVIPEEA